MTTYTIQESPLGTFALLLGTQLIMQSNNREDCERVMTALQNSTHADRAEQNATNNTIRDGVQAR